MKQRIFSRGKGWYIPCSNYRDPNDKAYLNVHFGRENEPAYVPPVGNDFTFLDIDILEAKFTSYQSKANMFVFKYTIIKSKDNGLQEQDSEHTEYGRSPSNVEISPDDLPFY